jgi:hypothetical protein
MERVYDGDHITINTVHLGRYVMKFKEGTRTASDDGASGARTDEQGRTASASMDAKRGADKQAELCASSSTSAQLAPV